MKKFVALCMIAAIALVVSCQESAQTKAEREQMTAQIKTLEGKVTEMSAKVEMLMTDFTKHMADFHTKAPARTAPATKPAKPPVKPPTRK
jgi:hypothetical protein